MYFIYFFGTHLFMYTWRSTEIFECLIITIPWGPMLEHFFHIQIPFHTTPISVAKQVSLTNTRTEEKNNIHFGWRDQVEKYYRNLDKKVVSVVIEYEVLTFPFAPVDWFGPYIHFIENVRKKLYRLYLFVYMSISTKQHHK